MACAHHWWKAFLDADTPTEAYAAWMLFLNSADRRAWAWANQEVESANSADAFSRLKLSHVRLNHHNLKRAMEKREEKLDKELFGLDIYPGLGTWLDAIS